MILRITDYNRKYRRGIGGMKMSTFKIKDKAFYYNGEQVQIISGAIHYFRTVPAYWEDRLMKLKACGFNTVETYIPWNIHEPQEGVYDFEGMKDVVGFIKLAGELGLFVIIRPSPYICAEWECGGLPSWLLRYPSMRLRCYDTLYLEKIDAYYDKLLPMIRSLQCTEGGPVIAMQIENEYGSYGNDKAYLQYLKTCYIKHGIDVLLFTSDGPDHSVLQGGTLDEVYKTANFGSRTEQAFKVLEHYEEGPLMCMEYWNGWFDHWGEEHHTTNPKDTQKHFEDMIRLNGHVNFYMFHGGTNFGFMNGANYDKGKIQPTITSYDYDTLLTEAGDLTEKYRLVQESIKKHFGIDASIQVSNTKKKAYGTVSLTRQGELFSQLNSMSKPVQSAYTKTMEELGQDYGFVLYRTVLSGPVGVMPLQVLDYHDRAMVYLDGVYQGVLDRSDGEGQNMEITIDRDKMVLEILVENLGRINYGEQSADEKGITKGVALRRQFQYDWTMYPLPLDNIENVVYTDVKEHKTPCFYKGTFQVDSIGDTFLSMKGWAKGVVYVNGFNLGRYWEKGPQDTLYVPGPILREGENELVIFELHGMDKREVTFLDHPLLG